MRRPFQLWWGKEVWLLVTGNFIIFLRERGGGTVREGRGERREGKACVCVCSLECIVRVWPTCGLQQSSDIFVFFFFFFFFLSLNHSSIVNGARASGSNIRVFKHDNPSHLEQVLRNAIISGQPRTSRPWKKILVVCEGIYSMEGEIGHFKEIVDVCKKYKAYVYIDEAHSIGALGATGRGVAEKCGVDSADIDIMMGTFTKSFGGMGGYICGSKDLIDYIRATSSGMIYSNAMSPVICKQILRALQVIMGLDGTDTGQRKIDDLRNNANYFRKGLVNMGLQVLGDADSPVMPVLLYNPTKIGAFSRECLKRGLAVVCVGFPATPLIESRARFCISAGHTKENLDYALEQIDEIADLLKLKYDLRPMLG